MTRQFQTIRCHKHPWTYIFVSLEASRSTGVMSAKLNVERNDQTLQKSYSKLQVYHTERQDWECVENPDASWCLRWGFDSVKGYAKSLQRFRWPSPRSG